MMNKAMHGPQCLRKPAQNSKNSQHAPKSPPKVQSSTTDHAGKAIDYTQMFQESQKNIMRLNQSRLSALNELKAARQRISELENRLAEAAEQLSSQQACQSEPQVSQEKPIAQEQNPAESQPSITIAYSTGWQQVYMHYRSQTTGWTDVPGVLLQPGEGEWQGCKVVHLPRSEKIEFVMNNGQGDWDTPDVQGSGKNYAVDGPGEYHLKSGRIQKRR